MTRNMKASTVFALAFAFAAHLAFSCTTVVVSGRATADGRPMLLKTSDASASLTRGLRVFVYSPAKSNEYAYVANVRVDWKGSGWAGCGMNEKGLAIVNNTAVDLNGRTGPGVNMIADVLCRCATVADVRAYLEKKAPFSYGSNYGFIDAVGGAAYFECGGHGVDAFDVTDPAVAPEGWLVRTNFAQGSHGNRMKGSGLARYNAVTGIVGRSAASLDKVTVKTLMSAARCLKHGITGDNLLDNLPTDAEQGSFAYFKDFIPRYNTESAVVFRGVKPGEDPRFAVAWITPGNPLTSPFVPVWVESAESIPKSVWSGVPGKVPFTEKWHSALMDWLFPIREYKDEGLHYIRRDRLANKAGTGVLAAIEKMQEPIFLYGAALDKKLRSGGKRGRCIGAFNDWLDMFVEGEYRKFASARKIAVNPPEPVARCAVKAAAPPSDAARRARVALYCGPGARGSNFCKWIAILTASPDVEAKFVDGAAIRGGALDGMDVLVVPGGSAKVQSKAIGEDGAERIRAFVRAGGGYIGTCAGAFYAMSGRGYPALGIVPLTSSSPCGRGEPVNLTVSVTKRGEQLTGVSCGRHGGVQFHGGPLIMPGSPVEGAEAEIVATFDGTAYTEGIEYSPMNGFGSQAVGTYGKGRVCLFSTHPESQPRTFDMIAGAFKFVYGKAIAHASRPRRKGAASVAVCACLNGIKEAETFRALNDSPDIDLVSTLPSDWCTGVLDRMDALVLPDGEPDKYEKTLTGGAKAALAAFAARGGKVFFRGEGAKYAPKGAVEGIDAAAIFNAVCAMRDPAPARPTRADKPLKVALYTDRGASGANFLKWILLLSSSPDIDVTFVTGKSVMDGALNGMDVLVMPGGSSRTEYESLGCEKGGEKVREFVRGGGRYFGTCAGAFLASCGEGRLCMAGVRSTKHTFRGATSFLSVETGDRFAELAGMEKGVHPGVNYHGGPLLFAEHCAKCGVAEIVGRFAGNVYTHGICPLAMNGYGAFAVANYGKGKVFVSSVHPEASEKSRPFIVAGFKYLTGRDVRFAPHVRHPGALSVAFCTCMIGPESSKALAALADSPKTDVFPVSPSVWTHEGTLDHADVLVLADGAPRSYKSQMDAAAKAAMAAFVRRGGRVVALGEGAKHAPRGARVIKDASEVVAAVTAEIGIPQPGDVAAKTIREDFKTPPPGYGEVPFWWWSGREPLDRVRLLEQIEELHKAGIAGVQVNYAHYRTGTRPTQDSTPPLFTDEWWDYFSFAAQECARRGMGISLSNYTLDFPEAENLWRKIGISTPELRATELAMENGKVVKRKVPRTYDPLNPESGKRVVERFFDPFFEKVPENARGALNYFFQDELILTRDILWLWSDDFPAEFKKRKGYDVEPMLPALFGDFGPDTVKVRLDMNDVMSALACERYYKPIYDWHASRGLIYGCDQATRGKHPMNKYIDYMRVMKYFTSPGFDTPGRSADIIKNKVGSSIAHLNRRPRVWLEGYHSQGWQASTSTIFDSTCHNYLYGSNILNLHGLYYSTYGGWWEWAPPCYHFRMPYWTYMKTFLKYFERLSYILSQGTHVCDVAVVNPLEPCVYNRNRGNVSVGVSHDIARRLITEAQTDVDFIDADSLAKATTMDGRLCVAGEAYRTIILPDMIAIRRSSLEKLVEFKRAGGVVVVLGDAPKFTDAPHADKAKIDALVSELTAGTTGILPVALPAKPSAAQLKAIANVGGTPDFRTPGEAKALHRRIGKYDVYFICDLEEMGECTFRAKGTPELWDPWEGTQKALTEFRRNADGTTTVKVAGDGAPKLVVFAGDSNGQDARCPSTAASNGQDARCPSTSASVQLDGEWDFTLKPTLDNKWGDFRLPVRERYIGAEIRRVKMVGAEKLNLPAEMTVGFGPQFLDGKGLPFLFSWREGVENMPGFQDWHHGLNGIVGDDFFVLGPYSRKLYDVSTPKGAKPGVFAYKTFVYAPCDCKAKPVAHGVAPTALTIDGKDCKVVEEVALAAGYHELSVTYEDFGRAALVMMRTDVTSVPSKVPLSMCWYNDPAVLSFDPFAGKVKEGVYTATLPPACEEIEITMRGTLLSANIAGAEAEVALAGGQQAYNSKLEKVYRVKPRKVCAGVAALTLNVAHEPGFIGGAVFTEPMRLKCGKGKIALNNWALVADGLRYYSGGAVYEKSFTLTKEQAAQERTLDIGGVGVCCGVSVNGGDEKVLCCPPWRVDVGGRLKEGKNTLKVTVYNTLNNHYQTIPTRYRTSVEEAPSGLLGPVTLVPSP